MIIENIQDYTKRTGYDLNSEPSKDLGIHIKVKSLMTKEGIVITIGDRLLYKNEQVEVLQIASSTFAKNDKRKDLYFGVLVLKVNGKIEYISPEKLKVAKKIMAVKNSNQLSFNKFLGGI